MKNVFLLMISLFCTSFSAWGQASSVFENYFAQAQNFSRAFPTEKVYLHFDNTSYYQGDTIWYKAYVVTAQDRKPSRISKPLYVELVDQLGNVMERQIVRLDGGEGHGQISLANTFFTGYYEMRAYTKWMLAFDGDTYFSRTFPVYRKPLHEGEPRSIASYRMDSSMKQRPKAKLKVLNANFYPEGGLLVQGIPTTIGFETLSRDSGWVDVSGYLEAADGRQLAPIATIHDGMGSFQYTPAARPATAVLHFGGKAYRFELPAAAPQGYGIGVVTRQSEFDVVVSRSSAAMTDSLALFIFAEGNPCSFVPVEFTGTASKHIRVLANTLPMGVLRMSLVNARGNTVADRFVFSYPREMPSIAVQASDKLYRPFGKVGCDITVTDAKATPMPGVHLSVAVRDGMNSDYLKYDNNILTDLLLTSDVKGYIRQPGFYFVDQSASRRRMLDNLLLIRGWRHYDVAQAFGVSTARPRYLPEDRLTLYGKVKSTYGKSSANLGLTVLARRDSAIIRGATQTDSLGFFSIPLDDMEGAMEALIQTRKEGKQLNRASSISLFRTFEPDGRSLDFDETNPRWDTPYTQQALGAHIDSLATQSAADETHMLDEVVVKGKKRGNLQEETEKFERDIIGFYNIRQYVDRVRDEGKTVANDVGYLMHCINANVNLEGTRYRSDSLQYSIGGKNIERHFLDGFIDEMETAMMYMDRDRTSSKAFGKNYRVQEGEVKDIWTGTRMDTLNMASVRDLLVRCDFTMAERWNINKNYVPSRGVRRTVIQGYNKPASFYSPQYPERGPVDPLDDQRRTLYWNHDVVTDEHGVAHIDCYNGRKATYVQVSAETIVDGRPAAVSHLSMPPR